MPVPKRKRSRARRDSRFANKGVIVKSLGKCSNCQAPSLGHTACKECGFYKGVKVMETKIDRTLKRGQVRQAVEARKRNQSADAGQSAENK